ncbi:ethanolamine ammonia-lyase reactivating factor EutA [Sporomusa acidovorans]|uniref:Reactivating factor for ethanolamine ammonia lyase n=1 Tax=Sporomusa acidovorans (strain ATCC 49682 / DSM 3132 / Mol) TaxID=1123286 RepID=A0ABZ3J846_SPOA4|nr:ethanolamine ammonia-lyase reactivating factor EutA [Sporomusa acidovorans]OZC21233.1 reactivating factor for ethanolamine ammonia lyase [Sporomusa acidovorans DSM 3132]SDE65532.1 ethanolamine utilization protein EutA [Sporomusa acidovorans]
MSDPAVQTMTSVGIDIGTTTTQLVISRLTLENTASAALIPRVEITGKEVIYRSQIYFTPLLNHHLVNAVEISRIVESEYRQAGVTARDIDTGAVIITGETAKKENAKAILEALANFAGDFVVATAGPNLEAVYAGKGSGAAAFSQEKHQIIVNIDVGGGTANYAVFHEGQAIDTACLNVGGHLIEIEPDRQRVTYIAGPAQAVLKSLRRTIQAGEKISLSVLTEVAAAMAHSVVEVLQAKVLSDLTRQLLMTPSLSLDYPVTKVMISGGVADYVYAEQPPCSLAEVSCFGDFGPLLGWKLKEALLAAGFEPVKPLETVRATVIGTGTQSVNLSGSTIHVAERTLPLRNVLVALPFTGCIHGLPATAPEIAALVRKTMNIITADNDDQLIALAMKGPETPTFDDIQILARGVLSGMAEYLVRTNILIIILEKDCGKILGQSIAALYTKPLELICIDQLAVGSSDYIDIGKPVMGGRVVPVVIKTLLFETKEK